MKPSSRLLLALASLSLLLLYITPLWRISLDAPQYPEGIGMLIQIDNVTGVKPNDLQNINGLNHYIGMKRIVPESIPELKWMPWIIGFVCLFGVSAAALGRRGALYAWSSVFLIVAIVGLVDFYLWEYDYGHNLDLEHASIKVPGMTYQPPLIGSKKLLNFTAHSWPDIGGWTAIASLSVGLILSFREWRLVRGLKQRVNMGQSSTGRMRMVAVSAFFSGLFLAGCAREPVAIHYGSDTCTHCRMVIADPRFSVELVTGKGKVLKFDAVECAAAYAAESGTAVTAWVHLPSDLDRWVPAHEVYFRKSTDIRSPMGAGLAVDAAVPYNVPNDVRTQAVIDTPDRLQWSQVVAMFSDDGTNGRTQ